MPVLNPSNQFKTLVGTVINAGERARTIRVRIDEMKWNKRVQKYYPSPYYLLVRDTNRSSCIGDIVRLRSNWRVAKHVRHVLTQIVTPFGTPLSERPPVPSIDELQAAYVEYRFAKDLRQAARGREASATRLLEYPALTILEAVVDVNAGARRRLMLMWKKTIVRVPDFAGKGDGDGEMEGEAFMWKVRELLMEMKPRVREVLEDSREETPAERKKSINERLNRQGRNLVNINTLNNLVKRVNLLLESMESESMVDGQKRSQKDHGEGLENIRQALKESLEPQSPHVVLNQPDFGRRAQSEDQT